MSVPNPDAIRKMVLDAFNGCGAYKRPTEVVGEENSRFDSDEGISRDFRGEDWRDLCTIDDLQGCDAALIGFTLEAFVYFLPAFILASLDDWDAADLIPEWIFNRLERDEIVWTWLTDEQRRAVEAFGEWDEFMCGPYE